MNYTQAQIDRANAVSLEDFLRTQGETLIKSGREYRWKEHDSLTVRGNKWFRHSQSKGGYPIDFVMEFYGKSFPEAVQLLTGESAEGQSEATTAPPTAFHLPLHNRTADRAIQYLCESRGLNKTLVEAFLLSGDIYEDAKRHNVVFVGRDRSGTPRYAHVRGTADPFRQDIAGSDKSYPFRYEGNGNQLFVFEAPIDLLSFIPLSDRQRATGSPIRRRTAYRLSECIRTGFAALQTGGIPSALSLRITLPLSCPTALRPRSLRQNGKRALPGLQRAATAPPTSCAGLRK